MEFPNPFSLNLSEPDPAMKLDCGHRPVTPDTWESEAGGSQVQGLPGLHSEFWDSLSNLMKCFLKMK